VPAEPPRWRSPLGGSFHPQPFDNNEGAGKVKLPAGGTYVKTKVTVHDREVIDVPMSITASSCRLTGALWWPEESGEHNDVDISLIDPSGVSRAVSDSAQVSSSSPG
jgi:hypothetical protein